MVGSILTWISEVVNHGGEMRGHATIDNKLKNIACLTLSHSVGVLSNSSSYSSSGSSLCTSLNRGGEMRRQATIDNKYIKYDMLEDIFLNWYLICLHLNLNFLRYICSEIV